MKMQSCMARGCALNCGIQAFQGKAQSNFLIWSTHETFLRNDLWSKNNDMLF